MYNNNNGSKMAKHKNTTSEGNPLSSNPISSSIQVKADENKGTFRTTSNAYGNYYGMSNQKNSFNLNQGMASKRF